MRVNVYAEEMTDRVEIVEKVINGQVFTGLRIYLELPVTVPIEDGGCEIIEGGKVLTKNVRGPFIHHASLKEVKNGVGQYEVDDDSSAVTFWGKSDLRGVLKQALLLLDNYYAKRRKEDREEATKYPIEQGKE